MDTYKDIERTIHYDFRNKNLLEEALIVAGSPETDKIQGQHNCGNKRLALIGDALLRLTIVDEWYSQGTDREACEKRVQDVASNEHLNRQGHKMGIEQVVSKNPCQGCEVPKTAMASTLEAVIGAAWLDCQRDWDIVRNVAKILSESK